MLLLAQNLHRLAKIFAEQRNDRKVKQAVVPEYRHGLTSQVRSSESVPAVRPLLENTCRNRPRQMTRRSQSVLFVGRPTRKAPQHHAPAVLDEVSSTSVQETQTNKRVLQAAACQVSQPDASARDRARHILICLGRSVTDIFSKVRPLALV